MGVISHLYEALQGETDAAARRVRQLIGDSPPKVINSFKALGGCARRIPRVPFLRSLSPPFGVFSLQKHTLCDVCWRLSESLYHTHQSRHQFGTESEILIPLRN